MELEIVRSGALVELDKISCSTRASSPPRNYLYVQMVLDEVELSYRSFKGRETLRSEVLRSSPKLLLCSQHGVQEQIVKFCKIFGTTRRLIDTLIHFANFAMQQLLQRRRGRIAADLSYGVLCIMSVYGRFQNGFLARRSFKLIRLINIVNIELMSSLNDSLQSPQWYLPRRGRIFSESSLLNSTSLLSPVQYLCMWISVF